MKQTSTEEVGRLTGVLPWLGTNLSRLFVSLFVPAVTFYVLLVVFRFLRDGQAPQWVTAIVAIIWGVGGVLALFLMANLIIERFPAQWKRRLTPFVFVGPALVILAWYLFSPTLRTLWASLFDARGENFVGFQN